MCLSWSCLICIFEIFFFSSFRYRGNLIKNNSGFFVQGQSMTYWIIIKGEMTVGSDYCYLQYPRYALLCGNSLSMRFCPLNRTMYLFKTWEIEATLDFFSLCFCSRTNTTIAQHHWLQHTLTHTNTHKAVIKRSNPVLATMNYSSHRSHILMKWITVKTIVTLPEEQYTVATQRLST